MKRVPAIHPKALIAFDLHGCADRLLPEWQRLANPAISERLLKFRDAGIQVAIDDFGTGYSSLSYLKKFDIDFLKIDQSFTRNLAPESPDLAVCEAIVVMAHKLGLKVIAEGVETPEQLELLKQIQCDFGQGYLFSRPTPVAAFEDFLAKSKP